MNSPFIPAPQGFRKSTGLHCLLLGLQPNIGISANYSALSDAFESSRGGGGTTIRQHFEWMRGYLINEGINRGSYDHKSGRFTPVIRSAAMIGLEDIDRFHGQNLP